MRRRFPSVFTLFERLLSLRERLASLFRRLRRSKPGDPFASPRLALEAMEPRLVPDARPLPNPEFFVGTGSGDSPLVRGYAADTGDLIFEVQPYTSSFTGGVHVAAGDISGDGIPDAIVAPGFAHTPLIHVLDGRTGEEIAGPLGSFLAFSLVLAGDDRPRWWKTLIRLEPGLPRPPRGRRLGHDLEQRRVHPQVGVTGEFGSPCLCPFGEVALGECLDAPGDAADKPGAVTRAGRLAEHRGVLLPELLHRHPVEGGDLFAHIDLHLGSPGNLWVSEPLTGVDSDARSTAHSKVIRRRFWKCFRGRMWSGFCANDGLSETQQCGREESGEFAEAFVGGEEGGIERRRHVGTWEGEAHSNLRLATSGCLAANWLSTW